MDSQTEAHSGPQLTVQKRQFIKGILEGKSRIEAYRASYNTHAPPRSASAQARNLWKNPRIQEAVARGQKGDSAVLISCGFDLETCLVRKHLALLQNPAVPPYVQQRMLRDLWTIVQRKEALSQPEKTALKEASTLEDIESLLRKHNGRSWDENLAATPEDDEISLDDDPLPAPVGRNSREHTPFGRGHDKELDNRSSSPPRDPFSTPSPANRGLIRRFPNW
jgi:hypothetical protein